MPSQDKPSQRRRAPGRAQEGTDAASAPAPPHSRSLTVNIPVGRAVDMARQPVGRAVGVAKQPVGHAVEVARQPVGRAVDVAKQPVGRAVDIAKQPVATARRAMSAKRGGLPVYVGLGVLAVADVIDPPLAAATGVGYAVLRRWGPLRPEDGAHDGEQPRSHQGNGSE